MRRRAGERKGQQVTMTGTLNQVRFSGLRIDMTNLEMKKKSDGTQFQCIRPLITHLSFARVYIICNEILLSYLEFFICEPPDADVEDNIESDVSRKRAPTGDLAEADDSFQGSLPVSTTPPPSETQQVETTTQGILENGTSEMQTNGTCDDNDLQAQDQSKDKIGDVGDGLQALSLEDLEEKNGQSEDTGGENGSVLVNGVSDGSKSPTPAEASVLFEKPALCKY